MKDEFEVGLITDDSSNDFEQFYGEEVSAKLAGKEGFISLGATKEGLACGVIAGYPEDESYFVITSLYVTPEARRKGAATLLMDTMLAELFDINGEMAVAVNFLDDNEESESLIAFLNARGIPESEYDEENQIHYFSFFAEM